MKRFKQYTISGATLVAWKLVSKEQLIKEIDKLFASYQPHLDTSLQERIPVCEHFGDIDCCPVKEQCPVLGYCAKYYRNVDKLLIERDRAQEATRPHTPAPEPLPKPEIAFEDFRKIWNKYMTEHDAAIARAAMLAERERSVIPSECYKTGYADGTLAENKRVLDNISQYCQKHSYAACVTMMPVSIKVVTLWPLIEFLQSLRQQQERE